MRSLIRSLPTALLALAAVSCTTPADLAVVSQQLTGSFDWISSSGGIAGRQYTPESLGYPVRLVFTGQQVRAYRDGQLVGESRVTVSEDTRRAGPAPVYIVEYRPALPVFPFASFEQQEMRITGKLVVELADPCCDRFNHTFSKAGVR